MPEPEKNLNAHAQHGLEIPKMLQEQMLKFFLKAQAQQSKAVEISERPKSNEPHTPATIKKESGG